MSIIALIFKIITFPFFRMPHRLFTLNFKPIGILTFDIFIVSLICFGMYFLKFYEGIVIVFLYFLVAFLLGCIWRGLVKLFCKITNRKPQQVIFKGEANKSCLKKLRQNKISDKGLPDFDNMDSSEIGKWIAENPKMVRIKSKNTEE